MVRGRAPMRPLLIGEAPGGPRTQVPPPLRQALTGAFGMRVSSMAHVPFFTYLRRTDRINLVPRHIGEDGWPAEEARTAAAMIDLRDRHVLLFGTKVSAAFGVEQLPLYEWIYLRGGLVARVPHPSGRNRNLNDPSERRRMGTFVRGVILGRL